MCQYCFCAYTELMYAESHELVLFVMYTCIFILYFLTIVKVMFYNILFFTTLYTRKCVIENFLT